jgi:hypothetical protein
MSDKRTIDLDTFDHYLRWIIRQGAVGVAVNVDTGEGPTLEREERRELIARARVVDVRGARRSVGEARGIRGGLQRDIHDQRTIPMAPLSAGPMGLNVWTPNTGFLISTKSRSIAISAYASAALDNLMQVKESYITLE